MVKEWSISIEYEALPEDVDPNGTICPDTLDQLIADSTIMGPVVSSNSDPPMLRATVSVFADDEAGVLLRADAAIRRAYKAAGAHLGTNRTVDLIRADVLSEELGLPYPPDDEEDEEACEVP